MDSDFFKERAAQCRALAERADPFIKRRLLDLAARYDRDLRIPANALKNFIFSLKKSGFKMTA
jgi:hypothetical protein